MFVALDPLDSRTKMFDDAVINHADFSISPVVCNSADDNDLPRRSFEITLYFGLNFRGRRNISIMRHNQAAFWIGLVIAMKSSHAKKKETTDEEEGKMQ